MPRYCRSCILPETRPGVKLDSDGVCQGCQNAREKRAIDWNSRGAAFEQVVAHAKSRSRPYDCVIPVSGGKDSYWQVTTALEHGLHPLCVTYVVPGRNALGEQNLRRLVGLGVDHIDFRPNPDVERAFIEKAFRSRGISGLVTHMAIFSVPIQIALAYDAPLVIYGENSAFEYGTEDQSLIGARLTRQWLESFGVTDGTMAEDWIDERLPRKALAPYAYPTEAALAEQAINVVFLGYYFPWDPQNSLRIALKHGFQARPEGPLVGHYDYANIDDDLLSIHQHAKWYKFGITRTWDTLSMEIRSGRMSREQAIGLLRERGDETPWRDIELFCDYLGLSQHEYFMILERFRNPSIWTRSGDRWVIEDFLLPDFDWPRDPVSV